MNKFKLLTLSLVCATIAFGYNNSANAMNNKINNDNVINAVNSRGTVNRSAQETAYQKYYMKY